MLPIMNSSAMAMLAARARLPLLCSAASRLLSAATASSSGAAAYSTSGSTAPQREKMQYDVCIVGAGPAGLSAAIRFKQLCKEKGKDLSICVIEKGSEVGAHILSGNVLDPKALTELLPNWKDLPDCPIKQQVTKDKLAYLATGSISLPLPAIGPLKNKGNYVVSLSQVVRWLGKYAEEQGVDIFPGFAGRSVLYDWDNRVVGVSTNDFGLTKDGTPGPKFSPGVDLHARVTLVAEGTRGSLAQSLMQRYQLRAKGGADPQSYGLGIKEVWEVPSSVHQPGLVVHTVGYPMDHFTYGGGFIYHMPDNMVALGLVVALDYKNPHLSPYQEFQRWKSHPAVRKHLEGGTCVQYGARTLNEGGLQAIPKLTFPGGALLGCSAGFLNVPRIKGAHNAMMSGMVAGEGAFRALTDEKAPKEGPIEPVQYDEAMRNTWVWEELLKVRNVRPAFKLGLWAGIAYGAIDHYLFRGKAPWTFSNRHADHERLRLAKDAPRIDYPKPDGKVTFDLPTSLYRSGTNHDHSQPSHLLLKNADEPARYNLPYFDGPETKVCPAGVYEYEDAPGTPHGKRLRINAQNCLHCKACDIKDPLQNIQWTTPEGGGGPSYTVM